jgi:hypothetical protein
MSRYFYATIPYKTVTDVEAAVRNMKDTLDNKPTTWCVVKPMINPKTIHLSTGDVIGWETGDPLNDAQIKALSDADTVYNVYAIQGGDNFTEVAEKDVSTKVNDMRKIYANWAVVESYFDSQETKFINITNEDMSGYV